MQKVDLILDGAELRHGVSGVNVYLRLLTEALQRSPQNLTWRVTVPRPFLSKASFIPQENRLIVEGTDVRGYTGSSLVWNQRTASLVRRQFPEAVFHSVFHFWAPRLPARTLVTVHDRIEEDEPLVRPRSRSIRLYHWLARRTVRQARSVIAVSEWTRSRILVHDRLPAARISVLHNWVRPDCLVPPSSGQIARMKAKYLLPDRYIAYVGGYRAHKNVGLLIDAWSRARALRPMPALALAGDLPADTQHGYLCDVRGAIARANADTLLTPGLISDEDLPAFYAGADLFVSPSRNEGFGYPVVEALAAGAPVLVSDASAYPELVPEKHRRFSPDDPAGLASLMSAALDNPDRFRSALPDRFTEGYGKSRYEEIVRRLSR